MKEFEKTVYQLLDSNPLYAHLLMSIRRQFTTNKLMCKTLQVRIDSTPILTINCDYFLSLAEPHRMGALEHEMLHLILHHNMRMTAKKYGDQPHLTNVACDLSVNQFLSKERFNKDWHSIKNYKMPPNKTAEWYFEELKRKIKSGEIKAIFYGLGDSDGCVSPSEDQADTKINLNGLIKNAYNKTREEGKAGTIPGDLLTYIQQLLAPPKVPWNKELRQFAISAGRGYLKTTIMRESKRFGTVPGIKVRGLSKLLIVLDTSSSISDEDLKIFSNEIRHIKRNGAEIEILEVDTIVQKAYVYRNKIEQVKGRGGTNLRAAFDWIIKNKKIYDGIIFLTDCITYPAMDNKCPVPIKVLWISNSKQKCADWGKTIFIN